MGYHNSLAYMGTKRCGYGSRSLNNFKKKILDYKLISAILFSVISVQNKIKVLISLEIIPICDGTNDNDDLESLANEDILGVSIELMFRLLVDLRLCSEFHLLPPICFLNIF